MDARRERQAENELLFRRVNDRIEDLAEGLFDSGGDEPQAFDFVCECHRTECNLRLALTIAEYESVRADGRRFFVVPDPEHVDPTIEEVVDRSSRYWVVEKVGDSGELAEDEDPRD